MFIGVHALFCKDCSLCLAIFPAMELLFILEVGCM
jgi:hypothetical protein